MPGCIAIAQPLCLQIQSAQAKQPHLGIVEHGLEFLTGTLVIAFQQRSLCIEQVDQRFLIGADQLGRLLGLAPRQRAVTRASRDHAGRQRLITPVATADPEVPGDRIGTVPDRLQQPPNDHHRGNDRHDGNRGHHQADLVLIAAEGDDHLARAIG